MREQLKALREVMEREGIDMYVIPTTDSHGSEYVGDYFKCREYVSGFTGSAGTLVVTKEEALLWTDGRYFLQAGQQLAGSGIDLMKTGQEGVPTMTAWIKNRLSSGMVLGYNGRCLMMSSAKLLHAAAMGKKARVVSDRDLVGMIWKDRPPMSRKEAWLLDLSYAGESRESKIKRVRQKLEEKKADYLLMASLCDICWLLNVRGGDVDCTPVVLSYLILSEKEVVWYVQDVLPEEVRKALIKDGVRIRDYEAVWEDLAAIPAGSSFLYDPEMVSASLVAAIPDGQKKIEDANPTLLLKAVKNPVEVENERLAHIKDGVCLTRFIYWLKKHVASGKITERKAADMIGGLRRQQEGFVDDSFDPIVAYGPHGAIVHYSATEETDVLLKDEGFVLVDTGGHYLEGTTDVTRTISLGPLSEEEKDVYTMVLRGHIGLASATFLHGCTGQMLDALARTPLWEKNYDYNHGTGHGVGYLLGVHEGPNAFRFSNVPDPRRCCPLEEGMITSDEPGLYLEGRFGVRIENLVVCRKDGRNGFGSFLSFETLTMAPYDRAAILPDRMTAKELSWLNAYHQTVYDTISPWLKEEERAWLYEETRPL